MPLTVCIFNSLFSFLNASNCARISSSSWLSLLLRGVAGGAAPADSGATPRGDVGAEVMIPPTKEEGGREGRNGSVTEPSGAVSADSGATPRGDDGEGGVMIPPPDEEKRRC